MQSVITVTVPVSDCGIPVLSDMVAEEICGLSSAVEPCALAYAAGVCTVRMPSALAGWLYLLHREGYFKLVYNLLQTMPRLETSPKGLHDKKSVLCELSS